ncbi:MAG: hypothetical protein WCD75_15585 [Rhodoplanes sp.]
MRAAELAEQRPMPVQPLDAMIAFDPMTYGVTITAAQLSEVFEIHNKTSRGLQKNPGSSRNRVGKMFHFSVLSLESLNDGYPW